MRSDHFFDWHGFKFALRLLALLFIAGTVGNFGLLYATESNKVSESTPSLVLIQETHSAPTKSFSLSLSTTTSQRIINSLTIADAVPNTGKFISVDLENMIITLYQNGTDIEKYPILAKGKRGSPYETPAGFYTAISKENNRFNVNDRVRMLWSVQFYGNYYIHGWPHYENGFPVNSSYSDDGVRLSTENAKSVYDFVDLGTSIFVYDPISTKRMPSLVLGNTSSPPVSASSYLVADIDTGDVFLERNAENPLPIASATKLMAALVTNEMIPFDIKNQTQAHNIPGLVDWMNAKAKALDMQSTHFVDTNNTSTENISTADDLFRFAAYLINRKSFIFNTVVTKNERVSVFSVPINGVERRVAVIVMKSNDYATDAAILFDWLIESAQDGAAMSATACVSCSSSPAYRKIQL